VTAAKQPKDGIPEQSLAMGNRRRHRAFPHLTPSLFPGRFVVPIVIAIALWS
jgi:hypothetical protein